MFDIIHNHKISNFRTHAAQTPGAAYQPDASGVNLQEEDTAHGLYERNVRGLLLIDVVNVNTTGTLTIIVQDKNDNDNAWAELGTLAAISEAGLYYVDLKYFKKNVRLAATVGGGANVEWNAKMVTFDALKRPVVQSDSEAVTITYATGR